MSVVFSYTKNNAYGLNSGTQCGTVCITKLVAKIRNLTGKTISTILREGKRGT